MTPPKAGNGGEAEISVASVEGGEEQAPFGDWIGVLEAWRKGLDDAAAPELEAMQSAWAAADFGWSGGGDLGSAEQSAFGIYLLLGATDDS